VRFYRWLARSVLPFAFAVAIQFGALFVLNKLAVETVSSFGLLCEASNGAAKEVGETPLSIDFDTNMLCQPTRLMLKQGNAYEISVMPKDKWRDDNLPATADGLTQRDDIRKLAFAVPMRRSWGESWFRPIARIGATGPDEYALSAKPTRFVAGSSGELFLFVNDAVIFLSPHHFYNNNHGTATVTVKRVQSASE
jgi:hypothetical protein